MDVIKTKRMKSIKEKSHEIAWQYSKHYDPIACRQEWCEMAARAGANYVLDEIESLMKDVSDEYPRFQQGTIIHGRLIKLLEQLKK